MPVGVRSGLHDQEQPLRERVEGPVLVPAPPQAQEARNLPVNQRRRRRVGQSGRLSTEVYSSGLSPHGPAGN